jgi:NADPH2:quinone reductase
MRCAAIRILGENIDNLVVEERPDLEVTGEQVRVRVTATALNRADLLQRRGLYPAPPGVTKDVPGLEFVGNIDRVGPGVTRWSGGERVFGVVPGGSYASQVVTHEALAAAVPERLSDVEAAAVPEAFVTAYDALVTQARMKAGERVLIHAVASGVGTAAVQLANAWDAQAIGTTGSRHKIERVSAIAEFFPINYRETDFKEAIEDEFGVEAVDVILDVVGADYWERNIEVLARCGRLVVVGRLSGSNVALALGTLMSKRLHVMGTVMRSRTFDERRAVSAAFERDVIPLIEKGQLNPVIDSVYPFEDIHRATSRMENNENVGKIVLELGG